MVGMFMGEENAVDVGDVAANVLEASSDLASAETSINEQSC